jgi:DNA-binding transcriptional MerR regulator
MTKTTNHPRDAATPTLHRIGVAARLSGVSVANIRFYEKEGLLPVMERSDSSYRLYSAGDIHQLRFIRLCRAMDMSLGEVRTLLGLDLSRKADCAAARTALDEHLLHVQARLKELKALAQDLQALRQRCDGTDNRCHIIEALHERADALPAPPARAAAAAAAARRHV